MNRAPTNLTLRKAIREIVQDNFFSSTKRVLFLGRQGELREVAYPSDGESVQQAIRERMLADGMLGAVIHMCVAKATNHGYYSKVEVFDDPDQPTMHAMLSWTNMPQWADPAGLAAGEEEPPET